MPCVCIKVPHTKCWEPISGTSYSSPLSPPLPKVGCSICWYRPFPGHVHMHVLHIHPHFFITFVYIPNKKMLTKRAFCVSCFLGLMSACMQFLESDGDSFSFLILCTKHTKRAFCVSCVVLISPPPLPPHKELFNFGRSRQR
jgi:hypothetical protein